ncbi:MAG: T9SS type A sorting domain-containing protein [Bacteroidia bacterium]
MKKHFISTALLTLSTVLFGQDFASIGTQWYYSEHAAGAAPPNSEYLHLQSVADTVIDGKKTHKILRKYYRVQGDTVVYAPIYVYQESDTAYIYNFKKSRFNTLYIFNGKQGDTLTLDIPFPLQGSSDSTYRLLIDSVESVLIDGVSLKKFKTTPIDGIQFYNGGNFMERIGGLDWFFPRPTIIPEAGGPIRCYSDSQIDSSFQSVACNYLLTSSLIEINNRAKIQVYPNPFTNILNVQSEKSIERIELKDLTGKTLQTSYQLNLNCEDLEAGFYLLNVYLKSGDRIDIKVTKCEL